MNFAFHSRKPARRCACNSARASASKESSLTASPAPMARSATKAQWERHIESRCSCWFLALSTWKSNFWTSSSNKAAVEVENSFAPGRFRKQEFCSHSACRVSQNCCFALPLSVGDAMDAKSTNELGREVGFAERWRCNASSSLPWMRRSSFRRRLGSEPSTDCLMRPQKLKRPEPPHIKQNTKMITPIGVRNKTMCLNQRVSRQ
mmetsp:Transcript_82890/g.239486  ORF Transcript_82890/g.239486 Transcript_82890/m.239486 type:complete len:205 (+) Transcript_82890:2028-2642(+)